MLWERCLRGGEGFDERKEKEATEEGMVVEEEDRIHYVVLGFCSTPTPTTLSLGCVEWTCPLNVT